MASDTLVMPPNDEKGREQTREMEVWGKTRLRVLLCALFAACILIAGSHRAVYAAYRPHVASQVSSSQIDNGEVKNLEEQIASAHDSGDNA